MELFLVGIGSARESVRDASSVYLQASSGSMGHHLLASGFVDILEAMDCAGSPYRVSSEVHLVASLHLKVVGPSLRPDLVSVTVDFGCRSKGLWLDRCATDRPGCRCSLMLR